MKKNTKEIVISAVEMVVGAGMLGKGLGTTLASVILMASKTPLPQGSIYKNRGTAMLCGVAGTAAGALLLKDSYERADRAYDAIAEEETEDEAFELGMLAGNKRARVHALVDSWLSTPEGPELTVDLMPDDLKGTFLSMYPDGKVSAPQPETHELGEMVVEE